MLEVASSIVSYHFLGCKKYDCLSSVSSGLPARFSTSSYEICEEESTATKNARTDAGPHAPKIQNREP